MKLKKLILAPLFTISVFCLSNRDIDLGSTLYMEKPGDRTRNWIEIVSSKDSTKLLFYGHDTLADGSAIYYRAGAQRLQLTDTSIRFRLRSYEFSKEPFDQKPVKLFNIRAERGIPFMIMSGQGFSGSIEKDTMKLVRVSMLNNNQIYRLNLVKTKQL